MEYSKGVDCDSCFVFDWLVFYIKGKRMLYYVMSFWSDKENPNSSLLYSFSSKHFTAKHAYAWMDDPVVDLFVSSFLSESELRNVWDVLLKGSDWKVRSIKKIDPMQNPCKVNDNYEEVRTIKEYMEA